MAEIAATPKPRVPFPYRLGFGFAISLTVLVFLVMGLLLLPHLGFEYDEVTFCQLVFHPSKSFFAARISHRFIPVMEMSYVGALKVWLYWPLLKIWGAGVYSVRLPVLVMASMTIFLVADTVRRAGSVRAGIFTGALLASDVSFLLAETFDWGPVAVQNLLLSIALYCLLAKRKTALGLPIAAFALGLALWDKAIFVWILSGLCIFGVVFGAPVIRREITYNKLIAAAIAFSVGISPLIVYNVKRRNQTLGNSAHFALSEVRPKFQVVELALNGQSFREFLADPNAPVRNVTGQQVPPRFIPNPSSWRCLSFALLLVAGIPCARRKSRALILWLTWRRCPCVVSISNHQGRWYLRSPCRHLLSGAVSGSGLRGGRDRKQAADLWDGRNDDRWRLALWDWPKHDLRSVPQPSAL